MGFWYRTFVFASVALCVCLPGIRALDGQEPDKGFRDFRIVEPSELIQQLSVFEPENSGDENFDPSKFKDLATEGLRLLSELSPEQREKALDLADRIFKKQGLESEDSKALMNRLGVPEPIRKSLIEQFGEKGSVGKSNFRDVLSDALPKSKEFKVDQDGKSPVADREGAEKALERKRRVDGIGGGFESGRKDEAENPDIESGDAKTEGESEPIRPTDSDSGKDGKGVSRDGKGISRDGKGKPVIENGTKLDPFGLGDGVGDRVDGTGAIPRQRMPEKSDLKTESGQEAEKQAPGVGASELVAEDAKKRDGGDDWEEELNRILGVESKPTVDNESEAQEDSNEAESGRDSKADGSLKMLKDLASSPYFMDKIMKRNSGDSADSQAVAKDEPRLASVFDRTVVEAARGVLEAPAESGNDDKGFLARNVDSFFKKIVNSTVTDDGKDDIEDNLSRFNSDDEGWDSNGRSGGRGGALNSDWLSPRRPSRRNLNSRGRGERGTESEFELENQQPAVTQSGVEDSGVGVTSNGLFSLLFGLGIGGVIFAFLFTILNRRAGSVAKIISDRTVSRRIDRANFQSSQDLISLVDLFLLNKFGSESGWWNAKYAENILLSDAPEFETGINELVQSYVRLRYTRAGGGLTQNEQDNCRRTLKSLSKILSRTDLATRLRVEG